ncbi:MAG: class I SAM-dependent methyltransferase [bacterium]
MNYVKKHCLFCKDNEEIVELYPQTFKLKNLTPEVFSARRITEHFHYKIVRCQRCGLVFSRNILGDDSLSKLYSQSGVTFDEYVGVIAKDYLRHLKPFISKINNGVALEIGCSSGFFLEKLLGAGFKEVFGCEPSLAAKAKANSDIKGNIYSGFFDRGIYQNKYFDLICSFQTLDHLSDPVETVKICRDLLKPGGIVYFITHNVKGLQAMVLGEKSPIIDVEHTYLFNKDTLKRLCENAGLKVLQVGNIKNSYPLDYWMRMLLKNKIGSIIRSFCKKIGIGSISFPIAAGNIFVVARRND